jgi:hypothetical protein
MRVWIDRYKLVAPCIDPLPRDSGNVSGDSRNISRDSGNISRDSGNMCSEGGLRPAARATRAVRCGMMIISLFGQLGR